MKVRDILAPLPVAIEVITLSTSDTCHLQLHIGSD
jgi:hypothetical protein